jgi:hypothetical protein
MWDNPDKDSLGSGATANAPEDERPLVSGWAIVWLLSGLSLFVLCVRNIDTPPPKILNRVEHNGIVITVEEECGEWAISHCETGIFRQTPPTGLFRTTKQLLASSRDCSGFEIRFLEDSLLLAGATYVGSSAIDPHVLIPLGLSDDTPPLDEGFWPEGVDFTGMDSTVAFFMETCRDKKHPSSHLIHFVCRDLTSVTFEIYITSARAVEAKFQGQDLVEINVHWIGDRTPTVLMAQLPGEGRRNMEIFVKDKSIQ